MFDLRTLPQATAALPRLTQVERTVLVHVADGLGPREIAERLDLDEDELYRLVAWVLDELQPAPTGDTMADVHARHGSRAAGLPDVEAFKRRFGASLPPDHEG